MASRKKKNSTRKPGEDVPKMVDSNRVIRALEGTMTKEQFTKAYDDAALQRGGGLKTPSAELQKAYKKFQENRDFDAFKGAMSYNAKQASDALGRMLRWESAQ